MCIEIDSLFEDGDVVSAPQVAEYLGVDPAVVRAYAISADVPRIGFAFGFTRDSVESFVSEVLGEEVFDEGEDDDDDEDEGEDDDEDEDEDY